MTTISVSAQSPTEIRLDVLTGVSGNSDLEIQYCPRRDFKFANAPMFKAGGTPPYVDMSDFNQDATYFFRARHYVGSVAQPWSNIDGCTTPVATPRNLAPQSVMIQPALFVPPEPILQWFSYSALPGYPPQAMGRDTPSAAHMLNGLDGGSSGLVCLFDVKTAGGPIDTIAILGTNVPENATVIIHAAESQAQIQTGPHPYGYSHGAFRASANLPGRDSYHSLIRLPQAESYKFWRIEIYADVPGNVFAITHLILGKAWSTKNFSVDSKNETLLDGGGIQRDRGGNAARFGGWRGRVVDFDISQMTEAQYEGMVEHLRWRVGITEPILVVPNSKPGAFLHDRILYGQMAATRAINTSSPRFTQGFTIASII